MMKKILHIGLLSLLLSSTTLSISQKGKEKVANKDFDNYSYVNAIEVYQRLADKGYVNTTILENLDDAYYFNAKFVDANKWYSELFEGNCPDKDLSKIPSEYYYRYAQTLKTVGDYTKSNSIMNQFVELDGRDSRALLYEKNKNYLSTIESRAGRFELTDLKINSIYSDYRGTIYGDQFVFTSARDTDNARKNQIHNWTNQSFTTLYSSRTLPNDGFQQPVLFDKKMDPYVNEATAVFTKDGNTMCFTQNNAKSNGRSKQNKQDVSVLKIYKAIKDANGNWTDVTSLSINSDDYNTAHPALTPDEKWLYFTSDRHGTYGQADLFRVGLLDQDQLGPVENLDKVINTSGRETFPFISSDYELYFCSEGHPGLGGLNVFMSKIYPDGSFGPVVNMSEPINSGYDDFAFYYDPKIKRGFVSSNRPSAMGSDDIYFVEAKPSTGRLEGKVFDADSKSVLSNAMLIISDGLYQKRDTVYSDKNGHYTSALLDWNQKYSVQPVAKDYNTIEVTALLGENPSQRTLDIAMERTNKAIDVNDDLFKTLKLAPIHFDFDKSDIRPDAAIELLKVVEVMKQYPSMTIDVRSHTDSRASAAYNLALSERRAKSTVDWMIKQGIAANQLIYKGYGDTHLLNDCKQGVSCTAAQHQLNRRSEFIVTNIKNNQKQLSNEKEMDFTWRF